METTTEPQGNPLGYERIITLIRRFSIPSIISMVVSAVYNIVDQIFIGWGIGAVGMAATNVAFPLVTISTAIALLFGVGGASGFGLSLGRGEKDRAALFAGNALSLMAIGGVALGAVSLVFAGPLLRLFGATELVMPYALPYTVIIAIGIPFGVFSVGAGHIIRADGSPSYAMFCMLAGAAFNLIFDPVFLFVFGMGIEGIAWATTLGQVLSSALALRYLLRHFRSTPLTKSHLRVCPKLFGRVSALGAAACFNQLAMTVVQVAMNNTLTYYGAQSVYGSEIPLACVGAIAKVNIIFISFIVGIAQGCQPIFSFNYGAKKYRRVIDTYKTAATAGTIISVAAFFVFQLFPRQVMSIFGPGSEEYFQFAERYLRIYMLMTFVNGIQPITSNFFTSIGKAVVGMLMSMTRQIILLLPLILIFPLFWGIDGVMYAGPIADGAAAALAIAFSLRELRAIRGLDQRTQPPKEGSAV